MSTPPRAAPGRTSATPGAAIGEAPQRVAAKAQGNPLAAGLIAFGAGLLFSSLIPASEKEREAADALKTAAEPLTTELTEAAKNVAEGLREPAQEAMENVKASAADATETRQGRGPVRGRGRQGYGRRQPRTTSSRPRPAGTGRPSPHLRGGRPLRLTTKEDSDGQEPHQGRK